MQGPAARYDRRGDDRHASAGLHFFRMPTASDVGGVDVKVMIPAPGHGGRFPPEHPPPRPGTEPSCRAPPSASAFRWRRRPSGLPRRGHAPVDGSRVFLQSDIVSQQRRGCRRTRSSPGSAASCWCTPAASTTCRRSSAASSSSRRHAPQPRGGQGAGRCPSAPGSQPRRSRVTARPAPSGGARRSGVAAGG